MDGVAGLITASATFITAIVAAAVLIRKELKRSPRKADRIAMLISLLARVRDWYQGKGYEGDLPRSLRRDVDRVLDERDLAESRDRDDEDYE